MRATLVSLVSLVALLVLAAPAGAQSSPITAIDPGGPGEEPILATVPVGDYPSIGATPGMRVVRSGRRAAIVFDAQAARRFRRIAGGRVLVACAYADRPERASTKADAFRLIRVTSRRQGFRIPVDPRRDVCRIATPIERQDNVYIGGLVASVALTPWGRTILARLETATRMADVKDIAFDRVLRDGVWPPAQAVIADAGRLRLPVVALAGPDADPPPPPAIGVYSDGAGRFLVKARSADGFLLFSDRAGDVDAGNLLFWLNAHL